VRGKIDCFGLTDIGKRRDTNQDQFLIGDLSKSMQIRDTSLGLDDQSRLFGGTQGQLLVVADGMGGHAAGQRASTLAIDSLIDYLLNTQRWLFRLEADDEEDFVDDLRAALEHSQSALSAEAAVIPDRRGMGTTLTMAYIVWPRLYVVHAGDSRCYLFRDSRLRQTTKDHTVAQKMIDQGASEPEELADSRLSHIVWNVLGGDDEDLKPEVRKLQLAIGDTILLCSDGLTGHVSDEEIATRLESDDSAADICQRLVDAANEAGGSDNITVVVARFLDAADTLEDNEAEAAAEEDGALQRSHRADVRRPAAMTLEQEPERR
jgi:protein phosphatase